jgi:hypothetical protein
MEQMLVMDRTLVWDPCRLKEIDEAKALFLKFKKLGHTIIKANGSLMERFEPAAGQATVLAEQIKSNVMKILNDTGDERIIWTKENGKQAKKAKETFEELIKKGYTAYSVGRDGNKKNKITEFDVDAEEIILIPKTSKG